MIRLTYTSREQAWTFGRKFSRMFAEHSVPDLKVRAAPTLVANNPNIWSSTEFSGVFARSLSIEVANIKLNKCLSSFGRGLIQMPICNHRKFIWGIHNLHSPSFPSLLCHAQCQRPRSCGIVGLKELTALRWYCSIIRTVLPTPQCMCDCYLWKWWTVIHFWRDVNSKVYFDSVRPKFKK